MRPRILFFFLAIITILGLTILCGLGCSDSDTGGPQPTTNTVGSQGGDVTSDDGHAELSVPAGALDRDVTVQLTATQSPTPNAGLIADDVYQLQWNPGALQHDVTLTVTYDPGDVPSGVAADSMLMYRHQSNAWVALADCTVDTTAHTVAGVIAGPVATAAQPDKDDVIDVYAIGHYITSTLAPGSSTSFLVTSVLTENTCFAIPTAPLQTQTVAISANGSAVTFMGITGEWNGFAGSGIKHQDIPIDIVNGCIDHQVLQFTIDFPAADHFTATFTVVDDYGSGCEADDCTYTYELTGVLPE